MNTALFIAKFGDMRTFNILQVLIALSPLASAQIIVPNVLSRDTASSDFDWSSITPSSGPEWTPCYKDFTCARLEVPLDYGNLSRGNTAIAYIKFAVQNATNNLIVNPGGPGASGIEIVQSMGPDLAKMTGNQHNIVSFDPRGVGESGPLIDCWPNHPERRAQFERLFYPEVSNASSTALDTQYYTAEIFGKACTADAGGVNGNASFISTPAVAHDMLTYIKAEQISTGKPSDDSKISYYGVSYGTILGATFASLFPDRVERMILDGVFVASDYYNLEWKTNLYDTDGALSSFSNYCYQGGKENCSFWGPSASNITKRLNNIFADLKYRPIPIPSSDSCSIPLMATCSDLKQVALQSTYSPLTGFPMLDGVLSGLEQGNTSAYVTAVTSGDLPANPCKDGTHKLTVDASTLIKCVDGWNGSKFDDIEQYRQYVGSLVAESSFFGEVWPNNAGNVLCRSFNGKPPKSGQIAGSIMKSKKTSFPILFVTADIDPVTPKRGAYKMASVFPGSAVLEQASVGHSAIGSPSSCLLKNIQNYLNGKLPPANRTCQPDTIPFQSSRSA